MGQGWGRDEDEEGGHWDMLTPKACPAVMRAHFQLHAAGNKQGTGDATLSAEGLH